MNNIVLVSQVFYPDHCATSTLLTELILTIQNNQNKVIVICGFPNGVDDQVVENYQNFNGVDIYRCGIKVNSKSGL